MPDDLLYDRMTPDDEEGVYAVFRQAFNADRGRHLHHRRLVGDDGYRVLRDGGRVAAALALMDMGHWFGGRVVPAVGHPGIAVHPASRGRGAGRAIVTASLREAAERGAALASLYASSAAFYRALGFGPAGSLVRYEAESHALLARPAPAALRPLDPGERGPLEGLADAANRRFGHGAPRRNAFLWSRVLEPYGGNPTDAYLVDGSDGPEGYLVAHHDGEVSKGVLDLADHAVLTPRAVAGVLAHLAGHRMIAERVRWYGAPADPLILGMAENRWEVIHAEHWLLRVVDAAGALTARGYPPGVEATLGLDVADPILTGNAGRLVLRVAGGAGVVERAGRDDAPTLRLGIDALAPLYTGHVTPGDLARLGWVEGPDAAIRAASRVFAGPMPWMTDRF